MKKVAFILAAIGAGIVIGHYAKGIRWDKNLPAVSPDSATKADGFLDPERFKECEAKWVDSAKTKRFASAAARNADRERSIKACMEAS